MAPSKSAKKSAKSTSSGKTARKSTGGKGKTAGKTAADKTPAGRTTRSGGGSHATGGKSLPKKTSGKKTTGGKGKGRSAETSSRSTGTSIHKTGSRWGNRPGAPSDSQAVIVDSHGSPRDEEEDDDWELDQTVDFLSKKLNLDHVQYTKSLQAPLPLREPEGDQDSQELIQFTRGDRIWVLPDKQSNTVPEGYAKVGDLPDSYWWIGEIVNCCYVPADNGPADSQDGNPIGFLEVAWFYSYEHAEALRGTNLDSSWLNKVKAYKLEKNERILSDHRDFIPLASYAGFADGIFARLQLHGLGMSAADRLTDVKDRRKRSKKDLVWISGFSRRKQGIEVFHTEDAEKRALKDIEVQAKERARKAAGKRTTGHDSEDEIEDEEETSAERSRASSSKTKKRKSQG